MRDLLTLNWLFRDLLSAEADSLFALSKVVDLPADAILIEAKKKNDALWVIGQGRIAIQNLGLDDTWVTVKELSQGDIVGEMSWLDGHPASATTKTLSRAQVLRIPFAHFDKFLSAYPDAHIQILRKIAINLSHRLRG